MSSVAETINRFAPGERSRVHRSGYIASPRYDALFFLLSPILALAAAGLITPLQWPFEKTRALGGVDTRVAFFIGIFTTAHLFAVFFRSHANPEIFARYRVRFLAVPPLLFIVLVASEWTIVCGLVLAAVWDVYHSSMQNFGLCRIYDARLGNNPEVGRNLDRWLNHLLYIGPILAGASLRKTLESAHRFTDLGWALPARALESIAAHQVWLALAVIAAGALFLLHYAIAYRALQRGGHRISRQKIGFLCSVGFTSILAWGFLPPLEAFFVANLFHNLQYLGIVWWAENANIRRVFRLSDLRGGRGVALVAWLGSLVLLSVWYETGTRSALRPAVALVLVVTLLHFWYDGFIWSVRKREVEAR